MSDRYTGKPFLELLDSYVLDAIGHLDPARDAALRAREPQFHAMFGETGGWREIVVARMQFPPGMPGALAEVWRAGRAKFEQANGSQPDPAEFVRIFIDTKFPH